MVKSIKTKIFNTTFFEKSNGSKPMMDACENAETLDHKFIVASDIDFEGGVQSKAYGSFENAKSYEEQTTKEFAYGNSNRMLYEIVPPDSPCKLYADLEWNLNWKTPEQIKEHFYSVIKSTLLEAQYEKEEINPGDIIYTNACDETKSKGSLHAHMPAFWFNNIKDQKKFFDAVKIKITDDWYFVDETEKSYILKTYIDFIVYDGYRQMRLPYSYKMKKGISVRPFIPENETDFDIIKYSITDLSLYTREHPINVSKFDNGCCRKIQLWDKNMIQNILDTQNLDCTVDVLKSNHLLGLKNKRGPRKCVLADKIHESHKAYLVVKGNDLIFKCHSKGCNGKSKVIYSKTPVNTIQESDTIPFFKYEELTNETRKIINKEVALLVSKEKEKINALSLDDKQKQNMIDKMEKSKEFLSKKNQIEDTHLLSYNKKISKDLNRYCKWITGFGKPYVIYKETRLCKINEDEEGSERGSTGGKKETFWIKASETDFLASFKHRKGIYKDGFGRIQSIPFLQIWVDYRYKECYQLEDCVPFDVKDTTPKYVFNTFTGLAISRDDAMIHSKGNADILTNFIKNVWCSNDDKLYNYVISWMAHLIQRPWIKMKTNLVLSSVEGCGKGSIVQILGKILGEKSFIQPSSPDEIFGNFNSLLENKLLCFLDEMVWGGDKKKAGQLKGLLTESKLSINAKFLPARRVSNKMNFIIASNEDCIVPAGTNARRYTILSIKNDMLDYTAEQKKEIYEFCPYTFANFLYNYDITDFNPNIHFNTEGLKQQKIMSMEPVHRWFMETIENNEDCIQFDEYTYKVGVADRYKESSKDKYTSTPKFYLSIKKFLPDILDNQKQLYQIVPTKDGATIKKKVVCVLFPSKDECISQFNKLYNCEMITFSKTSTEDDDTHDTPETPDTIQEIIDPFNS